MNWNDASFLRTASAAIQWFVIVLASLAVLLQTAKHFVDLREKRISTAIAAEKDLERQGREQALHRQIEINERRIRRVVAELRFDVVASWKNGKLPDPSDWIPIGRAETGRIDFIRKDRSVVHVAFQGTHSVRFSRLDAKTTRINYYTIAEPNSDIFEMSTEDFELCTSLSFTGLVHKGLLENGNITAVDVEVKILVNSLPWFELNGDVAGQLDLSAPDAKALQFKISMEKRIELPKPQNKNVPKNPLPSPAGLSQPPRSL